MLKGAVFVAWQQTELIVPSNSRYHRWTSSFWTAGGKLTANSSIFEVRRYSFSLSCPGSYHFLLTSTAVLHFYSCRSVWSLFLAVVRQPCREVLESWICSFILVLVKLIIILHSQYSLCEFIIGPNLFKFMKRLSHFPCRSREEMFYTSNSFLHV